MLQHSMTPAKNHDHAGTAPGCGPLHTFSAFLDAIARRDADVAIRLMTPDRCRVVDASRKKKAFSSFFQLWRECYPRNVDVTAWFIDDDAATLEVNGELDAEPVLGYISLQRQGARWWIRAERYVKAQAIIAAAACN